MSTTKRPPVVRVTWVDSACRSGWTDLESNNVTADCESVGFLIHEDKTKVVISSHIADTDQCNSPMTIPRGAIRSVHKFKG